jgi:Tol biopolymer transport system component
LTQATNMGESVRLASVQRIALKAVLDAVRGAHVGLAFVACFGAIAFLSGCGSAASGQELRGRLLVEAYVDGDEWETPHLYEVGVDGSHLRRMSRLDASDPRWSPDGKRIAFDAFSPGDGDKHIYVATKDGDQPHPIAVGREPRWSPEGRRILFTSYYGELSTVAADGRDEKVLALHRNAFDPDWSPRGDEIVFLGDDFGDLYVVGLKDMHVRRITHLADSEHGNADPHWSADAKSIYFAHSLVPRGGPMTDVFYRVGSDGANLQKLTVAPNTAAGSGGPFGSADWSTDGRTVVYCNREGAIVILQVGGSKEPRTFHLTGLICDGVDLYSAPG